MAEKTLRIAAGFRLPLDVVTEATAIVATRGAGKSSASAVIVEEAFSAGVQAVVFDRTGVYWGLRSGADGTTRGGLPIYVLGGPHGDVPLESHAGVLIADLVVDSGHSFVLDLSDFSKSAAIKFAADFLERLYDRKARARTTTLLVMDEAHFYAPQTPRGGFKGDAARLMGAMEDAVGLGRSRGLGIVLTTQRTQALNKAVLDLIETLLVMRMLSPRARDAVQDWIREKHEDDREGVIATLESLATGTAWVWSPLRGILERVAVRRIKTFDSYDTPKPGQKRIEPKERQELNLEALGEQMRATVERAKENDPTELRKRLRELERELDAQKIATDTLARRRDDLERALESRPAEAVEKIVEVPVLTDKQIERVEQIMAKLDRDVETVSNISTALGSVTEGLRIDVIEALRKAPRAETVERREEARPAPPASRPPARPPSPPTPQPDQFDRGGQVTHTHVNGELPLGAAKLLTVLGQFPEGRTRKQLAVLAGYKASGSTFRGAIAELRKRGYASPASVEPIVATQEGLAVAPADPLPTGRALYEHWRRELPEGARKVLDVLYAAWPDGVERAELAELTGYEPAGSTFRGALAALRNVDLATKAGVEPIKASDELMEKA